ncbi:MAG: chemotaxis protein CheW [Isosphaeraceae bacterium]|nr:chemotaxis protein CheW [Isosphaeraceae bacterium]
MSGFDLTELLPFYLDETDEQINALNDALLRLEQAPTDDKSLREAFRIVHSIKGSSTVMGFDGVSKLTHHLETFFDQLRSGKRTLDRGALDLFFRSLDELRDYHRQLRSDGQGLVDLTGLTEEVIAHLARPAGGEPASTATAEQPAPEPAPLDLENATRVEIEFSPTLQWPDMKARLVFERFAGQARILATEPHADHLEEVESKRTFLLILDTDLSAEALRSLADVEGVSRVRVVLAGEGSSESSAPAPTPPAAPAPVVEAVAEETPIAEDSAPPRIEAPAAAVEPAPATPTPPTPTEEAPAPRAESSEAPRPPAPPAKAPEARRPKVTETVRVDVDRLDSLMNLAGELVISRARFFEIAKDLESLFRESNAAALALEARDRIDDLARAISGLSSGEDAANERIVSQVRRLSENFTEIHAELDLIRQGRERVGSMAEVIHQLSRVADGIQKGVLETRMVPIGPLFERFHRVIRDLRVSSGKEVVLRIDGESTELDKRMIDELGDPLIHMVRNSVDHGLEPPEAREAAGKSRTGTVWLAASHRGNSVVITVRDDGRGIDCERVRKKAVAAGLIGDDESRRLSERQLVQFIWHPGLSTAEKITDISGRGVGMDIVKSRIENLNGTVDVRTELGRGTTFSIRLPLTLAIMPVLLVHIQDDVYAIPQDHVDEIVEIGGSQLYRIHGMKTTDIRGKIISVVELDDVLRRNGRRPAGDGEAGEKHVVVVVQNGDTTIGLIVDHLVGMQEVVLKSLETNYRSVPCLSGASVLGDGRVALILDVDAIIERSGRGRVQALVG